jgi:eukaryotic-like serine/threonine-protein kinase
VTGSKICPQCGTLYEGDVRFCPRDGATLKSQIVGSDLIGSVIADRYHVLRKLGEGGMGQVYLAEHVKMGRKSAVKVMHPTMVHDAEAIGRFNREASNASCISHPNVAGIYDFGETSEGLIYLAMEYVEGEPLTALVSREGPLPAPRVAAIITQVADALAAAHELEIVHRDLKPDNIMIARGRDGRDIVKVVDFGIAKAAGQQGQNVTKTGLVVGTLEYMSPEQLAGSTLDGRSDLYSLAIVAFNALTRKLPFPANSAQESMIMRLTEPPKRLDEVRPDIAWPQGLQRVFDRGLARDANDRYPTVSAFADELRAVSTGELPLVAQAPSMIASTPVAAAGVTTAPISGAAPLPPTREATTKHATDELLSPTRPSKAAKQPRTRTRVTAAMAGSAVMLAIAAFSAYTMLGDDSTGGTGASTGTTTGTTTGATASAAGASTSVIPSGGVDGNPVTYGASTGVADSVPPAANPGGEALADLDRYEQLLEESRLSRADARETAIALRGLMTRLPTRQDSIRAGIVLALALDNAGDRRAMCVVVRRLVSEPSLSRAKKLVLSDLRREHCTPRPAATGY